MNDVTFGWSIEEHTYSDFRLVAMKSIVRWMDLLILSTNFFKVLLQDIVKRKIIRQSVLCD